MRNSAKCLRYPSRKVGGCATQPRTDQHLLYDVKAVMRGLSSGQQHFEARFRFPPQRNVYSIHRGDAGVAKMTQEDLFERAAECARMIEATSNPATREMLTHLRSLWINLANESAILSDAELAEQSAAVTRIHADLMRRSGQ